MRASLKNLVKLYMHDGFKTLDEAFRLKIAIAELIVRYELEDFEFIEKKIAQVKKDFSSLFKDENFKKDATLLEIIQLMIKSDKPKADKFLQQKALKFSKTFEPGKAESEIIDYNEWLEGIFSKR